MRVVVVGAGNVGVHMAGDLAANGHEVLLLERERTVVERLRSRENLAGVTLMVADACELSRLTEAGLERADVVAAVTGDDGPNLVVSPKNEWLFNETWGVDVSVSTPHLLTALVEEAVSVGTLVRLLHFEGGKAHLEEVTLAPGSPAVGKSLAGLELPRTCSIVAVIRDERVIVPRGDTTFDPGDEVLVLVTAEDDDALRAVFIG
jgi:trk system potassium uptake protein TrkA